MNEVYNLDIPSNPLISFTKQFISKNPSITLPEVKQQFIKLSPGFANDKMFLELIPIIYGIEMSGFMLSQQKK